MCLAGVARLRSAAVSGSGRCENLVFSVCLHSVTSVTTETKHSPYGTRGPDLRHSYCYSSHSHSNISGFGLCFIQLKKHPSLPSPSHKKRHEAPLNYFINIVLFHFLVHDHFLVSTNRYLPQCELPALWREDMDRNSNYSSRPHLRENE